MTVNHQGITMGAQYFPLNGNPTGLIYGRFNSINDVVSRLSPCPVSWDLLVNEVFRDVIDAY